MVEVRGVAPLSCLVFSPHQQLQAYLYAMLTSLSAFVWPVDAHNKFQ